jgi:glycosyltransferase involved in cell wall biosynthesis
VIGVGGEAEPRAPRVVCLLPVRNAADALADWLDEAAAFADAVVALDDGSTDDTGAILAAHPLVASVITNERRDSYLGWHDGRNRNRLLAAAADLAPDWIFSLDADERLDPTDADRLRQFVATEALPGCAYGFRLYRMHDGDTFDPDYEWVYRLFAFKKAHRFVNRRLDLVPIPTDIGPERWVMTTLRVKHYGEADEAGRERRVAKFREADPEGAFRDYYENLQLIAPGPFPRWRARPLETPALFGYGDRAPEREARPHVVCLLPARNCAHLLPGWFESISLVADAIVALDDGSVDNTAQLLRAHPLVARVLTNPTRHGFHDWDDGDNRNRLLAAAAELWPAWVISVDADERIPLEDAAALRRFLHDGAQPGFAYALASFRMIDDEDHYDRLDYDAYRLFAFEPGHEFPTDRLHAPPIPTAIPPDRWRQTTIRMKHLVSLTEADRRARREKFRQADPDCAWEPDYDYTIEPPGAVKAWEPRPLDLPVLARADTTSCSTADLDLDGPVLTVVVAVEPGDEHDAVAMLNDIAGYGDGRVELLAATRDGYAAGVLRRDVEHVTVVDIAADTREAGLRNAALHIARGDYVTFLAVGDRIGPDGLEELIDAHERGHGALSVRVAEPPTTPTGWAGLLLSDAESDSMYASFAREPLRAVGGFDHWAPDGLGAGAARALRGLGATTATVSSVVHYRAAPSVAELFQEQYEVGRWGSPRSVSVRTVAAWRRLHTLDDSFAARRPIVAGLIVASGAASWLGGARKRIQRGDARG